MNFYLINLRFMILRFSDFSILSFVRKFIMDCRNKFSIVRFERVERNEKLHQGVQKVSKQQPVFVKMFKWTVDLVVFLSECKRWFELNYKARATRKNWWKEPLKLISLDFAFPMITWSDSWPDISIGYY